MDFKHSLSLKSRRRHFGGIFEVFSGGLECRAGGVFCRYFFVDIPGPAILGVSSRPGRSQGEGAGGFQALLKF